MGVFQGVRAYAEALEWLAWLRSGTDQEGKKCRGGWEEEGIVTSDVLRTHVTNDMLDGNRKVGARRPAGGLLSCCCSTGRRCASGCWRARRRPPGSRNAGGP